MNVFVSAALQSIGQLTSLAFASAFCALKERQSQRRRTATCGLTTGRTAKAKETINASSKAPSRPCACFITAPNSDVAAHLASAMVQSGVAACVNQIPGVMSTYTWEGKMQTEQEVLLIVKTVHERLPDVQRIVREKHPFDCPELIAVDITAGLPEYLKWVMSSCNGSQNSSQSRAEDDSISFEPAVAAAAAAGGAGRGFV